MKRFPLTGPSLVSLGVFCVLALFCMVPPASSATDPTPLLAPGLESLLEAGSRPIWLFFQDKGALEDDPAALAVARERLSPRALARRAKVRRVDQLVGWTDLDLDPGYLAWLQDHGLEIRSQSRWLNAVTVVAGPVELALLRQAPFIARIEAVRPSERIRTLDAPVRPENRLPAPGSPYDETGAYLGAAPAERDDPIDYGGSLSELSQINVPALHELGYTGEGVIVGMLDTGFNTTHEALVNVDVLGTWDFINDDPIVANEPGDAEGQQNHGSMTLSTAGGFKDGQLVGSGFGASFYLAKTEDTTQEEPIEEDWWVEGIEWLEGNGCDIVSSSLVYKNWYVFEDMDGNTAVTTIAADYAVSLGVFVVNSAGNYRQGDWGHIGAPADGDSVVALGAVEESGEIAGFSSPGPTADGRTKPDVCARGVSNHVVTPGTINDYQSASGTSFSCPSTSGAAALLLGAVPAATPMQLRDALRRTASQADSPDNDYGWGIIDALAALDYLMLTAAPETPAATALLGNWPNPFNPSTTLTFNLPNPGNAHLAIYDLQGRQVTTLIHEELPAGPQAVVWNGRDATGQAVSSGIYLARLMGDWGSVQQRLVLLK